MTTAPRRQSRTIRRLEKAIDELVKIHDDGHGNPETLRILSALNAEIGRRYSVEGGAR